MTISITPPSSINPFTMDPSKVPYRVSQTPKEIKTPKTPKKMDSTKDWEEKLQVARKVSTDATASYEEENAKEPSTPMQNMRVFSAKITELEALTRLTDVEAEHLSSQIDTLKRERPEDEDTIAELIDKMRKKRKTSAEHIQKSLALQSERATFLESTTGSNSMTRTELLETILLAPTKQKRGTVESRNGQKAWKESLVEFYDFGEPGTRRSAGMNGEKVRYDQYWCPILREYMEPKVIKAAHIAPHTLGPTMISYLTGTATDTTMLMGNGILLYTVFEDQLDRGGIAFVPAAGTDDPVELKLVLVDESLRSKRAFLAKTWGDFDGQTLEFKNSARPQKRFLYLRYAMTILHAWRSKLQGFEVLQSRIWPSRLIWATPGKYIRKSPLLVIGGMIGEHLDQTFDDQDDPDISQHLIAKFRAVIDEIPTNDHDDFEDDDDSDE
jgi:hypothetical protein